MVSLIAQAFHMVHFSLKVTSIFFVFSFFGGKRALKMSNIFLFCSSYFSKLMKDTKIIFPQDKEQGCRLVFAPTKFPSSSMFPYQNFSSFILELLYLRTEKKTESMVSQFVLGFCRLHLGLNVT